MTLQTKPTAPRTTPPQRSREQRLAALMRLSRASGRKPHGDAPAKRRLPERK
jgi:hypothetical protein